MARIIACYRQVAGCDDDTLQVAAGVAGCPANPAAVTEAVWLRPAPHKVAETVDTFRAGGEVDALVAALALDADLLATTGQTVATLAGDKPPVRGRGGASAQHALALVRAARHLDDQQRARLDAALALFTTGHK